MIGTGAFGGSDAVPRLDRRQQQPFFMVISWSTRTTSSFYPGSGFEEDDYDASWLKVTSTCRRPSPKTSNQASVQAEFLRIFNSPEN